jgi:hypothetical protein
MRLNRDQCPIVFFIFDICMRKRMATNIDFGAALNAVMKLIVKPHNV